MSSRAYAHSSSRVPDPTRFIKRVRLASFTYSGVGVQTTSVTPPGLRRYWPVLFPLSVPPVPVELDAPAEPEAGAEPGVLDDVAPVLGGAPDVVLPAAI